MFEGREVWRSRQQQSEGLDGLDGLDGSAAFKQRRMNSE